MKRCTACGQEFPATTDFFCRHKRHKDGLDSQCKACKNAYHKTYSPPPEVRERHHAYNRAYSSRPEFQAHRRELYRNEIPEVRERRQVRQNVYRSHPSVRVRRRSLERERYCRPEVRESERIRKKVYRNRPEVREQRHAQDKVYRNRPEIQAQRRAKNKAYGSHPDVLQHNRLYAHLQRARKKAVSGTHTASQIQELLKRQHYRCYYSACGHARLKKRDGKYIYHIDHPFPVSRVAGTDIPANDISYLVLTCPTSNMSKGDKYTWKFPEGGRLL